MTPEVPLFAAPLAALRDGHRGASHPLDRPVTLLAPDDYGPDGLARIELEGPRRMARALVIPFLAGVALVGVDGVLSVDTGDVRRPVKVDVVLDQLMRAVADLPEGPAGWGPYNRLRRLHDLDADQCREYLRSVIAATVRIVPAYRPPTPTKARRPPLTLDQQREAARLRKAASRDALRAREEASVRAWLAERDPLVGRVNAAELAEEALAWIEYADAERAAVTEDLEMHDDRIAAYLADRRLRQSTLSSSEELARRRPAVDDPGDPPPTWEQVAAENGYPLEPRTPLRRRFYEILDGLLGHERVRSHGARYYVLDEPLPKDL